jgi:hypothetical protein
MAVARFFSSIADCARWSRSAATLAGSVHAMLAVKEVSPPAKPGRVVPSGQWIKPSSPLMGSVSGTVAGGAGGTCTVLSDLRGVLKPQASRIPTLPTSPWYSRVLPSGQWILPSAKYGASATVSAQADAPIPHHGYPSKRAITRVLTNIGEVLNKRYMDTPLLSFAGSPPVRTALLLP